MNLYRSIAIIIAVSTLFSAACSKATKPPASSSAGALTANSAVNPAAARPFGRHTLNAAGSNYLNEFMRPDVRARLDEEPTGDTDGGYDPGAVSSDSAAEEPQGEAVPEGQSEDAQQRSGDTEESYATSRLDTQKYSWATRAFGDAVKASPTNNGVIILYADENFYDIEKLMGFVEEGRNRVAQRSEIGGERFQVVFGGYRSIPQVELWVIPEGGAMPEFKTDDRSAMSRPKTEL